LVNAYWKEVWYKAVKRNRAITNFTSVLNHSKMKYSELLKKFVQPPLYHNFEKCNVIHIFDVHTGNAAILLKKNEEVN
jgi:hypothetical protein